MNLVRWIWFECAQAIFAACMPDCHPLVYPFEIRILRRNYALPGARRARRVFLIQHSDCDENDVLRVASAPSAAAWWRRWFSMKLEMKK
jgi:hypothetical protein